MAKDREDRALSKPADKRAANQTLSEEERALWEHAARNLKPLRGKARVHRAHEEPGDPVTPRAAPTEKPRLRDSPLRAGPQPGMPAPGASTPPQLSDLDRRKARRIGTGKIDIEARIDLHGMRQSEAHAALRRFLRQAHAVGRRWVLIITGKGGPLRRSLGAEPEYARLHGEEDRGVLKRNVPRWLAEPELRSIVVGFTAAAVRHGGEGALYVQLRRKDRSGDA